MDWRIASSILIVVGAALAACSSDSTLPAAGGSGGQSGGSTGGSGGAGATAGSGRFAGTGMSGSGGEDGGADVVAGDAHDAAGDVVPESGGNTVTVQVGEGGLKFAPSEVTIAVGDTVHWVWAASGHNVVSGTAGTADDKFCSPSDTNCASTPVSSAGDMYDHLFMDPGTYPYFCRPHAAMGMTGTITVTP